MRNGIDPSCIWKSITNSVAKRTLPAARHQSTCISRESNANDQSQSTGLTWKRSESPFVVETTLSG